MPVKTKTGGFPAEKEKVGIELLNTQGKREGGGGGNANRERTSGVVDSSKALLGGEFYQVARGRENVRRKKKDENLAQTSHLRCERGRKGGKEV